MEVRNEVVLQYTVLKVGGLSTCWLFCFGIPILLNGFCHANIALVFG